MFHAAIAIPDRFAGVLSVDPLGAVGDGGMEAFGAEMLARVPEADRERARLLDEKDTAGTATPEEELEAFSLFWASYFADPPAAPPMPHVKFSQPANQGLWADLMVRLPELESSLPSITVPFGVIVGEVSPMPPSAGIGAPSASLARGRTSNPERDTSSGTKRQAASLLRWTGSSRVERGAHTADRRARVVASRMTSHSTGREVTPERVGVGFAVGLPVPLPAGREGRFGAPLAPNRRHRPGRGLLVEPVARRRGGATFAERGVIILASAGPSVDAP